MADDKKTQMGPPGRTHRPTGNQASAVAANTTPAPSDTAPSASSSLKTSYLPPPVDPLIGTTLAGRYLIDKKLGEGGMGAVYLATHNVLEKAVALKILHGEFARKQDLVDRFMQEAKAASRIRHENVIDISDFGQTPEGLVFFAMELLKGHDLHDEIARARVAGHLLPWSRTKRIFLQICSALSAAHAKGIVHRDLKPENIFLIEFLGDGDFVKLLDFGIAKLTEAEGEGGRKLTKTGMLFGTPEYMSPEQARGEQVDHRVDIYAMGCILFQLVTNRVPFEADNFMGVLSMHLTEPPPQIAPEVFDQIGAPRALAHVIDRALLKDRNQRYSTIDELANAVREVCGDPIPTGGTKQLAASVPSPTTTTTRRAASSPTGEVSSPKTVTGPEQTGRIRTQWTGNISVPEQVVDDSRKAKSKLPLVIAGLVVAAGAAVAIAFVAKGGSKQAVVDPNTGSAGSAIIAGSAGSSFGSAGSATVTPPPPPPEPKLPDMVKITLDTVPHGATVTDVSTGKPLPGKTPLTTTLPGSKTNRQYAFHLRNYGDAIVELPLNRELINYTETLVKGATSGPPAVKVVDDATLKAMPPINTGSGATKPPDVHNTGSAAVVTHPDTGSAVTHPDTGSATPPKGEPCTDADDITNPNCLKKMPKDMGSAAGSAN